MFKKRSGFSLVEVMIVIAIIGLLSAILIPAIMRANLTARQQTCVNNLREIDQAIQQWAMESKALPNDVVLHTNLIPYLRVLPSCPSPSTNGGTFFTDYGMTFVKDPPFCFANNGLEGSPHVFIPAPVPSAIIRRHGRPTDNAPKPPR